jgi:hypothetical protein
LLQPHVHPRLLLGLNKRTPKNEKDQMVTGASFGMGGNRSGALVPNFLSLVAEFFLKLDVTRDA